MHGPEYTTLTLVGLFDGKKHAMTSDTEMEDQTSRDRVMRWISGLITSEGVNAPWVADAQMLITKASLSFPAMVWRSIIYP